MSAGTESEAHKSPYLALRRAGQTVEPPCALRIRIPKGTLLSQRLPTT